MFNESNVVKVTTLKLTVNKLIVTYRIAGYFRTDLIFVQQLRVEN